MPYKYPIYQKNYYQKNRKRLKAQHLKHYHASYAKNPKVWTKYVMDAQAKRRAWINELKDNPCVDCGIKYPPWVMDYDHVRGKKLAQISSAVAKGWGKKRILGEMAKCDLVCSNCHRERTHNRHLTKSKKVIDC